MQNMIQWHCYVCQLSADMNMHVIHHNHIVKYARTYHMMSCIVYQYIYMYMIYVLFYASQQTKKLGRLCILSTLTPDHQPMVGPSSDLPQPVSFAFRNSQKTCPSRWGHSENPRKSHRHIKSCILFCSRRNYGVNCSWTKIQSPQVEPPHYLPRFLWHPYVKSTMGHSPQPVSSSQDCDGCSFGPHNPTMILLCHWLNAGEIFWNPHISKILRHLPASSGTLKEKFRSVRPLHACGANGRDGPNWMRVDPTFLIG